MVRLIPGSAHDIPIPDACVHTIVTSPPYWGLRVYSGDQAVDWPEVEYAPMTGLPAVVVPAMTCELGMETDPEAYVGHIILCLRELWRVLREDGTLWLNMGDSYNGSGGAGGDYNRGGLREGQPRYPGRKVPSLKAKDLCGMPWRVALAAQADGWWLRSDTIWAKPNPMPESARDRPAKSHEHVFLLTKSAQYYYDSEAVREPAKSYKRKGGSATYTANGSATHGVGSKSLHQMSPKGRNLRDVWFIPTQATPYAHFATFPERLVEPCVQAGTSEYGCCPWCGAPYRRIVQKSGGTTGRGWHDHSNDQDQGQSQEKEAFGLDGYEVTTVGWEETCDCGRGEPVPCVVLDPFHGSGTTGLVADRLGRDYIGVEICEEYLGDITSQRFGRRCDD